MLRPIAQAILMLPYLAMHVFGVPLNSAREIVDVHAHESNRDTVVHIDVGASLPHYDSEGHHSRKLITPLESSNVDRRVVVSNSDAVDARDQQNHLIHPVMMYKRDNPSFRQEVLRRWFEKHYHIGIEH